jgi:hypothetical protein
MKLKSLPHSGEYDLRICAVEKCTQQGEVIDATGKVSKVNYSLCEVHWQKKCAQDEKEAEKSKARDVLHDRG